MAERYLGDGLYASFDGFTFRLRAPRERGDHWVALEPHVLRHFYDYVRECGRQVTDPEKVADGD